MLQAMTSAMTTVENSKIRLDLFMHRPFSTWLNNCVPVSFLFFLTAIFNF